jgi:hypothetical protein
MMVCINDELRRRGQDWIGMDEGGRSRGHGAQELRRCGDGETCELRRVGCIGVHEAEINASLGI